MESEEQSTNVSNAHSLALKAELSNFEKEIESCSFMPKECSDVIGTRGGRLLVGKLFRTDKMRIVFGIFVGTFSHDPPMFGRIIVQSLGKFGSGVKVEICENFERMYGLVVEYVETKGDPDPEFKDSDFIKTVVHSLSLDEFQICDEDFIRIEEEITEKPSKKQKNDTDDNSVAEEVPESIKEEEQECAVCMEQPADTTVLPCMHRIVCEKCSRNLECGMNADVCVICRGAIEAVLYDSGEVRKV